MLLRNIIANSALFTDEKFSDADLLSFANRAIARINNECNTLFPDYTTALEDYTAIPKNWQLDLISPYLSYGIKMNDTSIVEADRYLQEFYQVLNAFKGKLGSLVVKYANGDVVNGVSSEYVDPDGFGGAYGIDTANAVDGGWFGSNGNAGSW